MEISTEQFQELIARRLINRLEETDMARPKKTSNQQEESSLPATPDSDQLAKNFAKVEKNLSSLGFFTPSSKKIKDARVKVITFSRVVDGKKVDAKVTIASSGLYGLPITADQDKYFALQKLIGDRRKETGTVTNPVGFTSAELLRLLGKHVRTGKNYDDILEWMKRMTGTTITSEGAIFFAGKKKYASDTFHVFERAVAFGNEQTDGTTADQNYVWLSEWQLENINSNYVLPVDFEIYKNLKNHIAKALVPLLQIWLYASQADGYFEKRYDELCQILNIKQYQHLSKILEKVGPALKELKEHAYIADWKIERTTDKKAFKVIFYHGEKFYQDQERRLGRKAPNLLPPSPIPTPAPAKQGTGLLAELTKRGVLPGAAKKLLASLPEEQPVLDQLEWGDHLIAADTTNHFRNPPGFYLYLIRGNVSVPEDFETSRKRQLREERHAASERAAVEHLQLQEAYEEYCKQGVDHYIATRLSEVEYQQIVETKKQELYKKFSYTRNWDSETMNPVARGAARTEVSKRLIIPSFEEFCARESQHKSQPPSFQPVQIAPTESAKDH